MVAQDHCAQTLGVLPKTWLDTIVRPLREPRDRPLIAVVSLPRQAQPNASLEESLTVDYVVHPEDGLDPGLLDSWERGHSDRLFLCVFTAQILDRLSRMCAEASSYPGP